MNIFHIREMNVQDQSFLWDMLHESLLSPLTSSELQLDERPSVAVLKDWGREGDYGLLAEDNDGEPMGAALVRLYSEEHKGQGFISESIPALTMAIRKEQMDRGVGTALLTALFDELKKRDIEKVSLCVDPNNEPAMLLYYRFGFKETSVAGDSVVMLAALL